MEMSSSSDADVVVKIEGNTLSPLALFTFSDTRICVPGQYTKAPEFDPYMMIHIDSPSVPPPVPTWEVALKITFYVIVFLVDICGNTMVVLIIVVHKKMRNATNWLILNLAVSDLMVGCFCMWVHAGNRVTTEWPFDTFVCKVSIFFQVVAVTSSVLTLTAISVERFFAIVYPLKSRFSPLMTRVVVVIIWIVSIAMASPFLVVTRRYELFWKDRHEIWCEEKWPKIYVDSDCKTKDVWRLAYFTLSGIVMFFVPIIVMVATYSIIVVKMLVRKMPGTRVTSTAIAQERSRRKVVRMLIVIVAVFVCCWTPQQVILLWDVYRPETSPRPDNIATLKYIAVYIAYMGSALNPILYGGFNENFRRGFKEAVRGRLWRNRNAVNPGSRTLGGSNTTAAEAGSSTRHALPLHVIEPALKPRDSTA